MWHKNFSFKKQKCPSNFHNQQDIIPENRTIYKLSLLHQMHLIFFTFFFFVIHHHIQLLSYRYSIPKCSFLFLFCKWFLIYRQKSNNYIIGNFMPIIRNFLSINEKILIVEKQKSIFWKARVMGFLKITITFM